MNANNLAVIVLIACASSPVFAQTASWNTDIESER
jgi:hypothetical protein